MAIVNDVQNLIEDGLKVTLGRSELRYIERGLTVRGSVAGVNVEICCAEAVEEKNSAETIQALREENRELREELNEANEKIEEIQEVLTDG